VLKRRQFLAASGAAALAPLGRPCAAEVSAQAHRDYLLLQRYELEGAAQRARFDAFLRDAAIPALNRLGVRPVGVFYPRETKADPKAKVDLKAPVMVPGLSPAFVLLPHNSVELLLALVDKLLADGQFASKGTDAVDAITGAAAFRRMESSLHLSLRGVPEVEVPLQPRHNADVRGGKAAAQTLLSPSRVFQLRIYESPSIRCAKKKIEMFNDAGELRIFRRVGLHPVFFGETLAGDKMPNLTYMLGFESAAAQDAAWKKFGSDPDWLKLRKMDEYADKRILCGVTNLLLKPAEYSQI
jgi:hypothetical protein